jgi:hypothetical protein
MKALLATVFSVLLASQAQAFANGGGSSVGSPPNPFYSEYTCHDGVGTMVQAGHTFPQNVEEIRVTPDNSDQVVDSHVERVPGSMPGAPLVFRGERFELSIVVDGPHFNDGHVEFGATLEEHGASSLELTCEAN